MLTDKGTTISTLGDQYSRQTQLIKLWMKFLLLSHPSFLPLSLPPPNPTLPYRYFTLWSNINKQASQQASENSQHTSRGSKRSLRIHGMACSGRIHHHDISCQILRGDLPASARSEHIKESQDGYAFYCLPISFMDVTDVLIYKFLHSLFWRNTLEPCETQASLSTSSINMVSMFHRKFNREC